MPSKLTCPRRTGPVRQWTGAHWHRIERWLGELEARTLFIEPRSTSENGYIESQSPEEMDQLSESFDLVYTRYALHHLDAPRQFPENKRSVLRAERVLLIVDWVEGARTGVPEGYFALQTVVRWLRERGFEVLSRDLRAQTMVIAASLRLVEGEGER